METQEHITTIKNPKSQRRIAENRECEYEIPPMSQRNRSRR